MTVPTAPTESDLYYDPYNIDLNMNPYPVFARFGKRPRCTTTNSTTSTR